MASGSSDGRIAYFFANAWNQPVYFSFQVNFTELGLMIGNQYMVYTLVDGIYSDSRIIVDTTTINISLEPQQIAMVVIIENSISNRERLLSLIAQSAITIAKSHILRAVSMNRTEGLEEAWHILEKAEDSYVTHNFTEAVSTAILAKSKAENASWPGYYVTVPLKLRVSTTAFWSSILFENARILQVVKKPVFLTGKGNAYVSSEGPILTGMNPHIVALEEKYGYQIVYEPSTARGGDPEIFELTIVLGIKPSEKDLRLQIGKESWSNYKTRLEITNVVNGAVLLNKTRVHGWSGTEIIEVESILPKYWLTVVSVYGLTEGSGQYTINTTASFSLKATSIDCHNGTRRVFAGWEGDYQGKMPSVSIIMDSSKTVIAKWETQYYLKIISEHGKVLGEGWYNEGSEAKFAVMSEVVGFPVKWIFRGWSGDLISESPNASILMNGPKTVIANWEVDYTWFLVIGGVITVAVIIVIMSRRRRSYFHKTSSKHVHFYLMSVHILQCRIFNLQLKAVKECVKMSSRALLS